VGDSGIQALKAFERTGNIPLALIFYGVYGTGKTSAAKAFVRDYYVHRGLFQPDATFQDVRSGSKPAEGYEGIFPPVLIVDAAVTRDIETIRDLVQNFMRTMPPAGVIKFVIFDEADRLGYDAQRALRTLLEKYPNTRTIYTTNELNKIDEAIQSRAAGGIFEFKYPDVKDVMGYLKKIAAREGVEVPEDVLGRIASESSSVREAVGKLGTEVAIRQAEKPTILPIAPPLRDPTREDIFKIITMGVMWEANRFYEEIKRQGFGVEVAKNLIAQLIREGEVYEPRHSYYARTRVIVPKEEEEVEEEKPISEEPEPIDANVHLEVDTYLEEKDGEYKIKPHEPQFSVLITSREEAEKPMEERWELTVVAFPSSKELEEWLAQGRDEYDLVESYQMAWGQEWTAIREALAMNPEPFKKWARYNLHWSPADIEWSPLAKKVYDIYHYSYTKGELEALPTNEVMLVATIKGVTKGKSKEEAIGNIIAQQAYKPAEVEALVDEVLGELESLGESAIKELEEL